MTRMFRQILKSKIGSRRIEKVDESMNVVIAKTEADLVGDREFIRAGETNLGNYITDAMLAKTKSFKGHEADVAIMNGGGIRAGKAKGDITKKTCIPCRHSPIH